VIRPRGRSSGRAFRTPEDVGDALNPEKRELIDRMEAAAVEQHG
jgi:hypothetical protein